MSQFYATLSNPKNSPTQTVSTFN